MNMNQYNININITDFYITEFTRILKLYLPAFSQHAHAPSFSRV